MAQKAPIAIERTASAQDVADALGSGRIQTVHDWAKDGCPHTEGRGRVGARYDLAEVAAWLKSQNRTGKKGRPPEVESVDLETVRIRKETAMAENWEHRNEILRRDVVPIEDVKAQFMEEVTRAKSRLSGLPADVAAQCEGLDAAEIQGVLQGRVDSILNDLASGLR